MSTGKAVDAQRTRNRQSDATTLFPTLSIHFQQESCYAPSGPVCLWVVIPYPIKFGSHPIPLCRSLAPVLRNFSSRAGAKIRCSTYAPKPCCFATPCSQILAAAVDRRRPPFPRTIGSYESVSLDTKQNDALHHSALYTKLTRHSCDFFIFPYSFTELH